MLTRLRDWFEQMRKDSRDAEHMRGYDLAAGKLLIGDSIEHVEALCYGSPAAFDQGMEHAIRDWTRYTNRTLEQGERNARYRMGDTDYA